MYFLIIGWFDGPLEPEVIIGPFASYEICQAYVHDEYRPYVPLPINWVSTCRPLPVIAGGVP